MKIVTYRNGENRQIAGVFYQDCTRIVDLSAGYRIMHGNSFPAFESVQQLIEGGADALAAAAETLSYVSQNEPEGAWVKTEDVKLLAPIPVPMQMRDFLCFEEHLVNSLKISQMVTGIADDKVASSPAGMMLAAMKERPIYYKCNRFGVIGTGENIIWPDYASMMDYELEFAAVIGRTAKDVSREEALDYIFGYTIFNDVSGRDYQMVEMLGLLGPGKGKDFDTGTVLGPCIVTADEIDPDNLTMIARINGKEVSRGHSSSMYHKFEDCIEHVSRCETLHPGEIIASGTVGGGSGFERFSLLSVNDEIELEVEGIGTIKNRIVAGPIRKKTKVVRQNLEIQGRGGDVGLKKWPYEKGLHALTDGVYAWLEPDGSWGFSNAGLIVDGDCSLVVDTLFDLSFTRTMLEAMKAAAPEATADIDILVNTHGDGDHWFGNELVGAAEIMATAAAIEDMKAVSPGYLALNMSIAGNAPTPMGRMLSQIFGTYRFDGISPVYPNKTVDRKTTRMVGAKSVELIPVGPAHTHGDMMVYLPEDRILFAGDIIFANGTPVIHSGPFSNYIDVCQTIMEMDVDVIVPGHGPITDKRAVRAMIEYLEYVHGEAEKRYHAGMSTLQAARDIDLKDFLGWHCPERLILNVIAAYQEFTGAEKGAIERFFLMAELGDF